MGSGNPTENGQLESLESGGHTPYDQFPTIAGTPESLVGLGLSSWLLLYLHEGCSPFGIWVSPVSIKGMNTGSLTIALIHVLVPVRVISGF